jgi:translation initiation factor RLI1
MTKCLGEFHLDIQEGQFTDSEIIVMLGENGTGKTTFIRLLAGLLKPDLGGKGRTSYSIFLTAASVIVSVYSCIDQ